MNDNNTRMTSDKFEWSRVWNFGRIYSYSLHRQIIVYGILSLISAILTLMPFNGIVQVGLFSMLYSALGFAYYLSPLVLSKWGDTRMIMNLTPVLPSEKFIFFMIYFMVVVPIVLFLPVTLSHFIYLKLPSIQTEQMLDILELAYKYDYNTFAKFIQSYALMLSCFYVVLVCKENRTLKGIIVVFGIMIGLGILGAIFGFTIAFHDGIEYNNVNYQNAGTIGMRQVMTDLKYLLNVLNVIFVIYSILIIWLSYKRLAHPKAK